MTLAERLSELRARCVHWHLGPVVRARRRDRSRSPGSVASSSWSLATWDIDRGLSVAGRRRGRGHSLVSAPDPLAAIKSLNRLAGHARRHGACSSCGTSTGSWAAVEVVQALDTAIAAGKQNRTFLVILSPVLQIPEELERQFVVIEHDLPPREQIQQIARSIATEPGELPDRRRSRRCARCRGWSHQGRGRECVHALADPPWPDYAGRPVGAQGPDAKEKRPDDDPPRRRDLCRPGRPGRPEVVLPAIADGKPSSSRHVLAASSCSAFRALARARSARPWATRSGGPRSSSTSGRSWARWSA